METAIRIEDDQQNCDLRKPSPVLSALRAATRDRHQVLDTSMPLSSPDAAWSDYVEHLQILSAWLHPLEKWMLRFHDGPQGDTAPKFIAYSELIAQDIGAQFKAGGSLNSWVTSEERAYRWGISYVVEGSQLGGEFLYKRLSTRLSPHPLGYLQAKQAGRWPAFLQRLAIEVTTADDIAKACKGAMDAFDALLLQLTLRENVL